MMVNYSYDELVGKDLIKLLVLEKYHDVLYQNASNHYPLPYEVEGKRRDGSIISVELLRVKYRIIGQ